MGVIAFQRPEKFEPHLTGKARCAVCQHEHVAVAPIGVEWMECPSCGLNKTRFVHDALPDESIWQCGCGCDVFRIVPSGTFCIHCGTRQRF